MKVIFSKVLLWSSLQKYHLFPLLKYKKNKFTKQVKTAQ